MSRSRTRSAFTAVRTEGGLLPIDLLERIAAGDRALPGMSVEDYHLAPHERVGEAANRAWSRLRGAWRASQDALAQLPDDEPATQATRRRWLLPLFEELNYGRLLVAKGEEIEGKTYPVSHTWHRTPIHLLGFRLPLDSRTTGQRGAATMSPHGLVQEFLNRSDDHLWGFVSNGAVLRILRDHRSLTRQAYVEFDLRAIMEGELYSEFLLLWLVCHQSRVEADRPEDCLLEQWFQRSRDEGVRALDRLRDGVEQAIVRLGAGFLRHRANGELHAALEEGGQGGLDRQEYYRQLLRLVYRLIFLFVGEERDVLLARDAPRDARERYERFYAARRLRTLAERYRGDGHADLWRGLRLVMNHLHDGCPALGLPALGSFLWSDEAIPAVRDAEIANEDLLAAVRALSSVEDGGVRRHVSWQNVGAEELGSIYEALLELHPRIHRETGAFELETGAGHERKTTSSFYTHASLVDFVLDSALDPVLDEAVKKPEPVEAILDLKVCDPACGSGHFLVAAGRRIARRLAAVRTGDDEPSPEAVRTALRDVVGRCLFGVDLNPMAVELCKVSLWMEAIEPGKPLSFLDGHIQHGNALIGTTPALMARGIPDVAFSEIEGDDKEVAKRLRKRNKDERKGQTTLFALMVAEPTPEYGGLSTRAAWMERCPDDRPEDLAAKERAWQDLVRSRDFLDKKFRADLWTAAFFWQKHPGALEDGAPTHDVWLKVQEDVAAAPQPTRREVVRLAREYTFFHWHLAFPQVFGEAVFDPEDEQVVTGWSGGFDVVFGNPPWDTLSPDAKEFFSAYDPSIRASDKDGQDRIIERLTVDSRIADLWSTTRRRLFDSVHFYRKSGRYRMFAPGNLGKGDFNVFRMFVEAALRSVREGGRASQLVQDGLYGGANCAAIREALFTKYHLELLVGFENSAGAWFPGVHRSLKFCLYSAKRAGTTKKFAAGFGFKSPQQLARARTEGFMSLSLELVREFSPDALAVMEFPDKTVVEIVESLYRRWPKFGEQVGKGVYRTYMREVDMGTQRDMFSEDPDDIPLYEGRMVYLYDHRAKGYRSGRGRKAVWDDLGFADSHKSIQPQWYVPKDQLPDKARDRYASYRVGFCDVVGADNDRTLMAAIIPAGVLCGHPVPTIIFDEGKWTCLSWLAVANSFSMDFLVRMKVSNHVTFTVMDSLPFPRLRRDDERVARLAPLVLQLTCTSPEMVGFWNEMAAEGWVEAVPADAPLPGELDEDARLALRAEIDAIVARDIYGLTRDELAYILDTFPIVQRRDEARYGDFRTKRLVLEYFDQAPAVPEPARVAAVAPASVDLSSLPDGAWARPGTNLRGEAGAALAALLKSLGSPRPIADVRLAAILALRPRLLVAYLDAAEAAEWFRLVGDEARPLAEGATPLVPPVDSAWGAAVRHLRGRSALIEDGRAGTWGPGPELRAFPTEGWPDGRASVVVRVLERVGSAEVLRRLPESVQTEITNAAG